MSSSVLRNVIHPRPSGSGPFSEAETGLAGAPASAFGTTSGDDMERVLGVLVENAPVAMAMFDQQMRYMLANRAWVEEFGLGEVQKLLGRSQYEVFPNLHPGWRQVYDRALQGHIIRSEHDALAGADGRRIIYRWEVRPWRRQSDANVGGLMIICERFQHGEVPPDPKPSLETDSGSHRSDAGAAPLAALGVPTLTLSRDGIIMQANAAAGEACLSRGLQEGETAFWEAFGDGSKNGPFKQVVLTALDRLLDPAEAASTVIQVPSGPARQPWGGTAPSDSNGGMPPGRWLLVREAGKQHEPALFSAIALPPEAPRLSIPPANLPAIASAVASIAHPPAVEAMPGAIELRRLQDDLARARQELRTLHEAEKTFAQREGRLKSYLDSLPFGVLVLNDLGDPVFQNQPLTRLLGRPVKTDETVEEWLAAACPSEHYRKQVAALWREDVWRRQITRTFSLATGDGLLKDLEFQPVGLPGGGLLVSIQDATEKVRHEEQLRATEAKFRALLQEAPLPVVLIDKAGGVFEVNSNAEELFGMSKNELRRLPLDQWFDDESAKARREAIRDLQSRGQRSTMIDINVIREDYDSIPVHLHLAQVMDGEGEPHCTIHFFELEPKPQTVEVPVEAPVASATIREQTSLPADPFTASKPMLSVLFQTNVNGRLKFASERGLELLGLAESESAGRPLHQHFRPSDATGFYSDLAEYAQDPKVLHELTCLSSHGEKQSLKVRVEALGAGGFDFAISEFIQAPAQKAESSTGGADLMSAAPGESPAPPTTEAAPLPTINLAREKLLLSETHHRIKNHLQIISSLLNLESNSTTDPSARNALRSSQNRVRSIADLHQHLYQVAVGASQGFREFAEGLIERLRECYAATEEHVQVELDLAPGEIQQEWLMPLALTLNETLSNCFEHAFPEGRQGQVKVVLRYEEGTGELSVTDNGIGLPANLRPGAGSGLGLKILAVFAEQMRGRLLTSRPDSGGTEIRLRFPMSAVTEES